MILGIVCGIAIAILIVASVVIYARPFQILNRGLLWVALGIGLITAGEIAAVYHFPGFRWDLYQYRLWALRIVARGPAGFYGAAYSYHMEYPPAAMYPIWLSGAAGRMLRLSWDQLRPVVEIPPVIMSAVIAFALFLFLRRSGFSYALAWAGMLIAALNPALICDTVVWGQSDGLVTGFMWLGILMTLDGEYELAAALMTIGVLTKPHALVIAPLLAIWVVRHGHPTRWLTAATSAVAAAIIAIAPFQQGRPYDWIFHFYGAAMDAFKRTSMNAFNFMALAGGLRVQDSTRVMGLSYFWIGMALSMAVLVFAMYVAWRATTWRGLMFSAFIALFGNFIFAPRMHERYLFPAFIFLVPLVLEEPFLFGLFIALTATWLFNLGYVFEKNALLNVHDPAAMIGSAFNLLLFGSAATYAVMLSSSRFGFRGEAAAEMTFYRRKRQAAAPRHAAKT